MDSKSLVPAEAQSSVAIGSNPLRKRQHERFCWLLAQMRPKADAYRQAGFRSVSHHSANANAARLLARRDIADRISYLTRQEEEVLQLKRARIEELLWMIHESNVADLWETYEDTKKDKAGNVVTIDGRPVIVKRQRPKLLSDLPDDVQRIVESCGIDEHGRVIPKAYSKLQANAELRKLLNIGGVVQSDEVTRMSTPQIVSELQALGVDVRLSVRVSDAIHHES